MTALTIDEIRAIMRRVAGVDESVDLDADIVQTTFTDLGYDSLAVLEVAAQIQRQHGVRIHDDVVTYLSTPGDLLEHVNMQLDSQLGAVT